jgi:hypothetical protein
MRLTRIAMSAAAAALALTTLAPIPEANATTPTQVLVRRPVTSAGHVAAGFTLHAIAGSGNVDCSQDTASSVAVNHGIFACSPSAAYAVACWHAAFAHHVLCYQNPFGHEVVRFAADAPAHAAFPREQYAPFGIVLDDGNRCTIRDGGAWAAPTHHPNWVGYYSCTGKDSAVWGPTSRSYHAGINESTATWTVYTGAYNKVLTKHTITKAWFVGTKRV